MVEYLGIISYKTIVNNDLLSSPPWSITSLVIKTHCFPSLKICWMTFINSSHVFYECFIKWMWKNGLWPFPPIPYCIFTTDVFGGLQAIIFFLWNLLRVFFLDDHFIALFYNPPRLINIFWITHYKISIHVLTSLNICL